MYYLVNKERKIKTIQGNSIWIFINCIGITKELEIAEKKEKRMNSYNIDDSCRYVIESVSKLM